MNNALVWRPRITLADATQRRLWENLRDFRDVSEETSLINLQGDVSEICKSALFETSLRRCMRRLRDASEMHPCPLGRRFGHCKQEKHQISVQQKTIFLNFYETKDYFFDLIIKTKERCAQYICSWETPEACPRKCSSKKTNTFLEEHCWGTASGTFGNVFHYFYAIWRFFLKQSLKETPEAVS